MRNAYVATVMTDESARKFIEEDKLDEDAGANKPGGITWKRRRHSETIWRACPVGQVKEGRQRPAGQQTSAKDTRVCKLSECR
jgi:hypothetical protein